MRKVTTNPVPLALLMGLAAPACNIERATSSYELRVRVSDSGRPLAGAKLFFGERLVGQSNDQGLVRLAVRGKEGDVVSLGMQCPQGFRTSAKSIEMTLHTLADPNNMPEFAANCQALQRTVVVAVRADNGPNLPITYLGQEVARTDASGAAHVLLTLAPQEEFELALDTSDKSAERLRPQNPSARFAVKNEDQIFSFNVPLTMQPLPPTRGRTKQIFPTRL